MTGVLAIVPTLGRNPERLAQCLRQLRASTTDRHLSITVVLNDPAAVIATDPDVDVLRPGLNLGFPGALCLARPAGGQDHLWIIQDDVMVDPGCLSALIERLESNSRLGYVAPVAIREDGMVPAGSRGGLLDEHGVIVQGVPAVDTEPQALGRDIPADYLASSGALIRAAAWDESGGFDPAFFPLLWSDVDICHRLRKCRWTLALEPQARIVHRANSSTPSLLGAFLGGVNGSRFRAKHFDGALVPTPIDHCVPDELVAEVAQRSSIVTIDFAAFAEAHARGQQDRQDALRRELDGTNRDLDSARSELAATRHELEHAQERLAVVTGEFEAIQRSHSWTLTAPLRRLRRLTRRSPVRDQDATHRGPESTAYGHR